MINFIKKWRKKRKMRKQEIKAVAKALVKRGLYSHSLDAKTYYRSGIRASDI